MRKSYKTEQGACEAWRDTFNAIPGEVISRAYRHKPTDLWVIAGGDRVSVCCGVQTDEAPPDGERPACPFCARPCGLRWDGGGDEWPHAWHSIFSPRSEVDARWIIGNAETIAATCHFMVYESDEAGVLLAEYGDSGDDRRDWLAECWLLLYRLRGLSWHRKAARDGIGRRSPLV